MKIREKYDSFALFPFEKDKGKLVQAFGLICYGSDKNPEYFVGIFPEGETVLFDHRNEISIMYQCSDLQSESLTNKIVEVLAQQGKDAIGCVPQKYRKALSL